MANSYVFYPSATGGQTDYAIPFEYLSQTFVKATVNGAPVSFTFLSTYMIRFSVAPVGALKIYRQTSKAPINTFINGSILVDDDLNGSFLQSLHIAEEVAESSMQTATDGAWDATNLKIKNVAAPTVAGDAATKGYVDTRFDADKVAVDASKIAAANSASAALASQNAAATSATNAATSKTGADTAKAGADTAKAGADTAKAGADAAKTAALSAQTAAEAARDLANQWANGAEDVPVSGGNYSAFHWARKALGYVTGSIAPAIHGSTVKATPADADEVALVDSTASWGLKKFSVANLKAAVLAYVIATASSWSATQTFVMPAGVTSMATATPAGHAIMALGDGTKAAYITLHRSGVYAGLLGLDTDNKLKWGGWSVGANAYEILHAGNYVQAVRKDANNSIGAAGFTQASYAGMGNLGGTTYTPDPTTFSNNFVLGSNNAAFTWGAPTNANNQAFTMMVVIVNAATAGTITLSGWNAVDGDAFDTTNGSVFLCTVVKHGGIRTLTVKKVV